MSVTVDLTQDYLLFDGLEAVTLTANRAGVVTEIAIPNAKRFDIDRRLQQSVGSLNIEGAELVFIISEGEITVGSSGKVNDIQPLDMIQDANGMVWSVQSASRKALTAMWWATCRRQPQMGGG